MMAHANLSPLLHPTAWCVDGSICVELWPSMEGTAKPRQPHREGVGEGILHQKWIYPEAVETEAWKPLTHIGPWVLIAARTCKVFCTGKQNQLAIRSISLQALLITCLKRPHTKKSAASKSPGVCSDFFCHSKEIVTFISNCVFVILYFS